MNTTRISLFLLATLSSGSALAYEYPSFDPKGPVVESEQDAKAIVANGRLGRRRNNDYDLRQEFAGYLICVERAEMNREKVDVGELLDCTQEFINTDPCVVQGFAAQGCRWGIFGPSHAKIFERRKNSYDEDNTVLVIDDFEPSPAFVRHQPQISAYYAADKVVDDVVVGNNEFRGFRSQELEVTLPVRLGGILELLSDLKGHPNSSELAPLLKPLLEAYGEAIPASMGHGNAVANILLDLVKGRKVVLLDGQSLNLASMYPGLLCEVEYRYAKRHFKQIAESMATAVGQLIRQHHVRYINASFGVTAESIRSAWNEYCRDKAPMSDELLARVFDVYAPIMEAIFDNQETIAFQAANERAWRDSESPFDEPRDDFSSRIRVGSFSGYDQQIRERRGLRQKPPGTQSPASSYWADVYIESGCDWVECRQNNPLSISHGLGVGRYAFPAPATSFVTPVALAEGALLDWLERRIEGDDSKKNRETVIDKLKERPYRDPLMAWF